MYKILATISRICVCYTMLLGLPMEVIPCSWRNHSRYWRPKAGLFYATATLDLSKMTRSDKLPSTGNVN